MIFLDFFFLVVWLAFWIYWFISAKSNKSNNRMPTGRLMRICLFFVLLILLRLTHLKLGGGPQLFSSNLPKPAKITIRAVGTVLFLAGLAFAVWARRNLGKNWGMPMSEKADPELVTTGPYRYVRHPIYSGIIIASFGTAIAQGTYWSVAFVVFLLYFTYSAVNEEKYLTKEFGDKYLDYKKNSKMLIPFIF